MSESCVDQLGKNKMLFKYSSRLAPPPLRLSWPPPSLPPSLLRIRNATEEIYYTCTVINKNETVKQTRRILHCSVNTERTLHQARITTVLTLTATYSHRELKLLRTRHLRRISFPSTLQFIL